MTARDTGPRTIGTKPRATPPAAPPAGPVVVPTPIPAIDQRLTALTQVDPDTALGEMANRLGRMHMQQIADGIAIGRLIAHIRILDPEDKLAAKIEAQRQNESD